MTPDTKEIKARLAKHTFKLDPVSQVKSSLMGWFLSETPSADNVAVVANTLRQSKKNPAYWEAVIQTIMYFPKLGPKIHNSFVFFYVDAKYNIINKNLNFKLL